MWGKMKIRHKWRRCIGKTVRLPFNRRDKQVFEDIRRDFRKLGNSRKLEEDLCKLSRRKI